MSNWWTCGEPAGEIYNRDISESDKTRNKKEPKIVSASSSEIYNLVSKHSNIMHLKIKSTGFIVETKDEGPIHEFFGQMVHLLHFETFETSLNRHIEKKGTTYKALLSYRER